MKDENVDTCTFANGCFWCTEAVFQQLNGVLKVTSGYSGGDVPNPTYEQVCDKKTGHAECLQIEFDRTIISFDELLEVFFTTHDPTTMNRQGNDVGPQYRSVIFYHNEDQKKKAIEFKTKLGESGIFDSPIVTAIEPVTIFYPAENYHSDYYLRNPAQSYCHFVVKPKVDKVKKLFSDKLKTQA